MPWRSPHFARARASAEKPTGVARPRLACILSSRLSAMKASVGARREAEVSEAPAPSPKLVYMRGGDISAKSRINNPASRKLEMAAVDGALHRARRPKPVQQPCCPPRLLLHLPHQVMSSSPYKEYSSVGASIRGRKWHVIEHFRRPHAASARRAASCRKPEASSASAVLCRAAVIAAPAAFCTPADTKAINGGARGIVAAPSAKMIWYCCVTLQP